MLTLSNPSVIVDGSPRDQMRPIVRDLGQRHKTVFPAAP
jgi:hypothetical protein